MKKPVTKEEIDKVIDFIKSKSSSKKGKDFRVAKLKEEDLIPYLNLSPQEIAFNRIRWNMNQDLAAHGISFDFIPPFMTFQVGEDNYEEEAIEEKVEKTKEKVKVEEKVEENIQPAKKEKTTFTNFQTEYIKDRKTYPYILSVTRKGAMPLIVGPPGCGKSRTAEEILKELCVNVLRFSMDQIEDHTELIGRDYVVSENGNSITKFIPGILVQCLMDGTGIVLDEVDRASDEARKATNMIAEEGGNIVVMTEKSVKVFPRHPNSRIIWTSNTWCRGDNQGFFQGAEPINKAWLSRIGPKFSMTYNNTIEQQLLRDKGLDENIIKILYDDVNGIVPLIRKAIEAETIEDFMMTRSLLRFADFYNDLGWHRAFLTCIVNDFDEHNRQEVLKTVRDKVGPGFEPTMDLNFIERVDIQKALEGKGLK